MKKMKQLYIGIIVLVLLSVSVTAIDFVRGQALYCDGTGDSVQIDDAGDLKINNTTPHTFTFWVKSRNPLIDQGAIFSSARSVVGIGFVTTPLAYSLWYDTALSGTFPNLDGTWQHVAIKVGGQNGTVSFYENSVWTHNLTGRTIKIAVYPMYIGRSPVVTSELSYFEGWIDEFRIYNRTLSDAEILNSYNKGVLHNVDDTDQTGLIRNYHFDIDFNDSTGNYNGVASGDAKITDFFKPLLVYNNSGIQTDLLLYNNSGIFYNLLMRVNNW